VKTTFDVPLTVVAETPVTPVPLSSARTSNVRPAVVEKNAGLSRVALSATVTVPVTYCVSDRSAAPAPHIQPLAPMRMSSPESARPLISTRAVFV
jgi:hypothetical protein